MVVVDCCAGGLAAVVDVAASGVSWGSVVAHCPMRGWCGVLEEFVGALSGDCTCASEYFGFSFSGRLMFFVCESLHRRRRVPRSTLTGTTTPSPFVARTPTVSRSARRRSRRSSRRPTLPVAAETAPARTAPPRRSPHRSGACCALSRGYIFFGVSQCLEPVVVAPTRHALLLYSARCSLPATLVNHAPCVLSRSLPCRTLSVAVPSVNLPCLTPSVAVYRL